MGGLLHPFGNVLFSDSVTCIRLTDVQASVVCVFATAPVSRPRQQSPPPPHKIDPKVAEWLISAMIAGFDSG